MSTTVQVTQKVRRPEVVANVGQINSVTFSKSTAKISYAMGYQADGSTTWEDSQTYVVALDGVLKPSGKKAWWDATEAYAIKVLTDAGVF